MKSTAIFADDQSEITLINNTTVATSTSTVYPSWGLMLKVVLRQQSVLVILP